MGKVIKSWQFMTTSLRHLGSSRTPLFAYKWTAHDSCRLHGRAVFTQVLKSLHTCSKNKTENNNLDPSLTHAFLGFSPLLSFSPVLVQFSLRNSPSLIQRSRSRACLTLGWDTSHVISPSTSCVSTCMTPVRAIPTLLKRRCGLEYAAKAADFLPTFRSLSVV